MAYFRKPRRRGVARRRAAARRYTAALSLIFISAFAAPASALTLAELNSILASNRLPAVATEAALESLIITIDPQARFLTEEEAAAFDAGRTAPAASLPPAQPLETWPQAIACLKINGLFPHSGPALSNSLAQAATGMLAGLIIDLRAAGGDDLQVAADLLSLLGAPARDYYFKTLALDGTEDAVYAVRTNAVPYPLLLAVLIDRATSGAAETLAAGLKNFRNVLLIGAPTSGDAKLRSLLPLPDGRRLRIATRRIEMGNNCNYDGPGVAPDVAVAAVSDSSGKTPGTLAPRDKSVEEQTRQDQELIDKLGDDAVMMRAVDWLLALQALGIHEKDQPATDPAR